MSHQHRSRRERRGEDARSWGASSAVVLLEVMALTHMFTMASPVINDRPAAAPDPPRQRATLRAVPPAVERPRGLVGRHPAAASTIAAVASRLLIFAVAFASSYWWGSRLRHTPLAPTGDAAVDVHPLGFFLSAWRHWDAVWFSRIAEHGYDAHAAAFFPLYPLLVRALALGTSKVTAAGVVVSVACFAAALLLLYRLVRDDFDGPTAAWTVILLSFASTSFFFQAVYSESLFLLLTVASFSAARHGRWVLAGLAGGLAALTRSAGILLLVPLAWMWLEQYRGGAIRLPGAATARPLLANGRARLVSLATLALVPAGLGVYMAYLYRRFGDPLEFVAAERHWHRSFHLPVVSIYDGAQAAWRSVRAIAADPGVYTRLERLPFRDQWVTMGNLTAFLALLFALLLLVACWRLLPSAYTALAAVTLLLPLSYPTHGTPLLSFPRFLIVDFPVFVALGILVVRRPVVALGDPGGADGRSGRVHDRLRQRDVGGVGRRPAGRAPGHPEPGPEVGCGYRALRRRTQAANAAICAATTSRAFLSTRPRSSNDSRANVIITSGLSSAWASRDSSVARRPCCMRTVPRRPVDAPMIATGLPLNG